MISVIVPVFNVENYLNECIDSVLKQTYTDWELLLIDDCSTDDSYAICRKFASLDDRIRLFRTDINRGGGYARNIGLDHAKGEWITFLDSDDSFAEDMLEYMYHLYLRTKADIVLAGWYSTDFPLGGGRTKMQIIRGRKILSHYLCFRKIGGYVCGKLYPKSLIAEERFFSELRIGEDDDFAIRMFSKARIVCYTNEPKYYYRLRADSASQRGQFTEDSLTGVRYLNLRKEYCLRYSPLSGKELERLWAVRSFHAMYGKYEKMLRMGVWKDYKEDFCKIRDILEATYKTAMVYSIHPKTRLLILKYLILRKKEKEAE